ncbi:putative cleavage stimulation factor, 77kDa subunit [Dioszegia hungarica]|uniref:mRNA 3'-end-processing protein RNA14 n=1 Tax=Dioszegia hungarica TaxID=4972 RepID=A0AA38HFS0_9TREE|nr:putative cleavage stimulation factor, 77kDa subunit [Dioszegia hungarica]KAI9638306.1 putative cleavage stimulation factor, 77kDa subunit [Dioszegia hungarica]
MEAVLEQSIPEAPAEATEVVVQPSSALQIDPSLIDPTLSVAPPLTDVPSTSPSVQHPQDAAQEPVAPVEAPAANGDEIVIDDDEGAAQASTKATEASTQPLESSVPAVSLQTPAPAAAAAELIGGPPLPEGLTSASPSVASNPDIIQDWQRLDPSNPQVLLALFDWSIQRSEIIDARGWYAAIAKENPTASQPLLALINLESSLTNFSQVEVLFGQALKGPSGGITASADVNIWKAYLHYIRRQNPLGLGTPEEESKRRVITEAYEFALKQCGVDREAGDIWGEYIAFVADAKPKNTWDTQTQQDSLRKIYQRAICIPLNNVEVLWKGYDAFESSVNKQTSKKFLAERSPAYMTARTALRELRSLTDVLPHPIIPPTPTFSDSDRQLVNSWKAYLKWEEGNPLVIADPETLAGRIGYAMRRCLAEMRHFPELWHYAGNHYIKEQKTNEAAEVLNAGVVACPKSILLTFATAEIEEDRKLFSEAHALFTNLLDQLAHDMDALNDRIAQEVIAAKGPEIPRPATDGMDIDGEGPMAVYNRVMDEREERGRLVSERRGKEADELRNAMGVVWVMYMRYARRAEGIKGARAIFAKARKSPHVTWHIYEASALMEYHVNKDSGVAIRIFELGFKLFSDDVDYVIKYLQFLLNVNDDTNARALFERSTLKIPADKAKPLWEAWAKYEYMYGDLGAVQKLESRFSETFPGDSPLKRFAQRYTYNGMDQIARRDLGFGSPRPQPAAAPQAPFLPPPVQNMPPPTMAIAPPPAQTISHPLPPRSHSPSRNGNGDFGGNKRYRPNSPPPPRRFDPGPIAPPAKGRGYLPPPGGDRPPVHMGPGPGPGYGGAPPRHASGNGIPPPPGGYGGPGPMPPRDGWDRSGVSKGVAWFVGQLPTARSFDVGPVFRPDDIMGLFSNIGPDGLRLPGGGPGPAGSGYGPPMGGGNGYAEREYRSYLYRVESG